MIHPLEVIFWSGAAAIALTLVSPLFMLRHAVWRRRAEQLNAHSRCGRCGQQLPIDSLYLYAGKYVCPSCAVSLRRMLSFILPAATGTAVLLAVSSGSALLISRLTGGPGLDWWLDWRWIPLMLPSVGTAVATAFAVSARRRANLLKNNVPPDLVAAGVPFDTDGIASDDRQAVRPTGET